MSTPRTPDFGPALLLVLLSFTLVACTSVNQSETMVPIIENADRQQMSMAQCKTQGGQVVGDIGDGRIHRVDYICENGKQPLGTIVPAEGEPQPIEGAVCC